MRKPFVAGNWKMYKNIGQAKAFAEEFKKIYKSSDIEVAVCAPYLQLSCLKEAFKGTDIKIGAQNVHYADEGAFTGEISCEMLMELGVDYVIIGHSERRQYFGETDETVNLKLKKVLEAGLLPIVCVGESLEEREEGRAFELVEKQLVKAMQEVSKDEAVKITIAYEPIWAIGTGKTATKEQANEMCCHIRDIMEKIYDAETSINVRIQYGGSVKPENASEILGMEEIDGALVGGASLKAESFLEIVNF